MSWRGGFCSASLDSARYLGFPVPEVFTLTMKREPEEQMPQPEGVWSALTVQLWSNHWPLRA